MSPFDDFVHVSTRPGHSANGVARDYLDNTRGQRVYTEGVIFDALRKYHPKHHLTVTSSYISGDLLAFGRSRDDVKVTPREGAVNFKERDFMPPARRYNDESDGSFSDHVVFGSYDYTFEGIHFLLYIVEGADGAYGKPTFNYLLVEDCPEAKGSPQSLSDSLIKSAAKWSQELHDEVLVFDQGYWQKSPELWENIQKAQWEDVILEQSKKEAIIDDVIGFFDGQDRYAEFNVPWKRGVIFYGPPGNGKTISTKALMNQISKRTSPAIETLYVKTFNSYAGPEFGIRQIFLKARQMAPCLLIFEDIDSLVNVSVRSYFLNEVDGLESNHGILMIGSTNHLERLDPGIAKRPSRFDRKYFFDVPSRDERIQYCEYWRNKLKDNKKIEFPKELSARVADITGDFSFAYMKEAFVAALLVIVAQSDEKMKFRHRGDPLSDNILWKEIKRQVENLRKEMDDESFESNPSVENTGFNMRSGMWPSLSAILREEDRLRPTRALDIQNNMMPRYF